MINGINRRRIDHLCPEITQFHRLGKRELFDDIGIVDNSGIGRHKPVDISPYFETGGIECRSDNSRCIIGTATPQIGNFTRTAIRWNKTRHQSDLRELSKSLMYKSVGNLEINYIFFKLRLGLDECARIVMLSTVDNAADDERWQTFTVTYNDILRLSRQIPNKRNTLIDIRQFVEKSIGLGANLLLSLFGDDTGNDIMMTGDNFTQIILIIEWTGRSFPRRFQQFIGNPAQSRNDNNNRLLTRFHNLFYIFQALDRPHRGAAEFQYFHRDVYTNFMTEKNSWPHPFFISTILTKNKKEKILLLCGG